jgi:hypothetical protein
MSGTLFQRLQELRESYLRKMNKAYAKVKEKAFEGDMTGVSEISIEYERYREALDALNQAVRIADEELRKAPLNNDRPWRWCRIRFCRRHQDCRITPCRADPELPASSAVTEVERLRKALEIPEVWPVKELEGMSNAYDREYYKSGARYESLLAAATWLLEYRAAVASLPEKPKP